MASYELVFKKSVAKDLWSIPKKALLESCKGSKRYAMIHAARVA
jgi:hypothetical protein